MLHVGLGLALLSALTTQFGFLLRHRGAVEAPDVDMQHPLRSIAGLFRSKWWTIGYLVAAVAYAFHVGALALAPLSIVQAVLAGGLVLLAVLADKLFGFGLGKREWTGVVLAAAGLAFLALTSGGSKSGQASADYSMLGLVLCETLLVVAGLLLIRMGRGEGRDRGRCGIYLAMAAGMLFTVSHVAIKAIDHHADGGVLGVLATPFPYLVVACGVVAFFVSARSLQIGEGVAVIAVTSIASNASAMPAGVLVFGDELGATPLIVAGRVVSFLVVIAAAALIPAPTRAGERAREAGTRSSGAVRGQPATV
jgi:multidrug transporter EmrE-like cation transporter